tara:strand:- start:27 stop:1331 length:1305 start_codon:yes stop_codon:yes gene_type:complete
MNLSKKNKIVYVPMGADKINTGHLNIINNAKKKGKVIIGLFSDKAIAEYKRLPLINYKSRLGIIENLKGIHKIIKQDTWDYTYNLKKIKPDFVAHGDDWKKGIQKKQRQKVIKTLKTWGGKLLEIKYTNNPKLSRVHKKFDNIYFNNVARISRLNRLFEAKSITRILEAHSPLTGQIIENLSYIKKNKFFEFDGIWSSSLTDSAVRGKPDNQSVDYSTRLNGLNEILDVTSKPVVFDGDNGGRVEHIKYLVRSLERLGVSALVIEDKTGLKKNSLFKNQAGVKQDSIKNFSNKIRIAKNAMSSKDMLLIARIESFILGKSAKDAIERANRYSQAGADAILIHSKDNNPKKIIEFAKKFKKSKYFKPLVAVPSTYSKTYENYLEKHGFKMVIYANQMLRASYPSMVEVAKMILKNKRSFEAEKKIIPIKEIINLT